jgi:hypothetical protein
MPKPEAQEDGLAAHDKPHRENVKIDSSARQIEPVLLAYRD